MTVLWGFILAILIASIIMSLLALRALQEVKQVRADITEFRQQLIHLASSNRRRRF